jgi:hypothetical protein
MIAGDIPGDGGWEIALTLEFDTDQTAEEEHDQQDRYLPVHLFMFPEMMQWVEEIGDPFVEKIHGRRIRDSLTRARQQWGKDNSTRSVSIMR